MVKPVIFILSVDFPNLNFPEFLRGTNFENNVIKAKSLGYEGFEITTFDPININASVCFIGNKLILINRCKK
jgi:hypothetical protein